MSREHYQKYLEILELGPDATLAQIKRSYLHLKNLYSSDSWVFSSIAHDFSEEQRKKVLQEIEEAYAHLISLLEKEDKKILKKEKKITLDLEGKREEEKDTFIENVLKQAGHILKAESLIKSFSGRLVVKGVNLELRSGEIIGLLGRNGAGKTTTFKMILGLLKPDSGGIYLNNRNISSCSTHVRANQGVIYLPQENSVFLKATVENNLKLVWELHQNNHKKQTNTPEQLLEELGLTPLSHQPAYRLSGGERRKLEICRALILDPKFLLLDEPFTGIDPLTIIDIQKILINLKNKGIGIILSDHNVRDIFRITDRTYVIDEGEILVEGNPQKIASDKRARERFLGKNFRLGEEVALHSS